MKTYFRFAIVLIVLLSASAGVFAQKQRRVKFAKGATAATISGKLNGFEDRKVFVINVREGQTLNVEQIKAEASAHYISVSITSPSGEDATDSDASCNSRKKVQPAAAGDYTMTIYECQKADAWRGKFELKISVE